MRLLAVFLVCLLGCAGETSAASNQEKLSDIRNQQSQAKAISKELEGELKELASEQRQLKKDLVRLAKELRQTEEKLTETKAKELKALDDLNIAIDELSARRGELEAMVQAAVRLSQVPPQAMVMMPEMSSETMQHARSMSIMADTLRKRAKELKQKIAKLHELRASLKKLRGKSEQHLSEVEKQRIKVNAKVKARTALTSKLNKQLGLEKTRMATLAKEAKDLKQLMQKIDKEQRSKSITAPIEKAVSYVESAIRSGGSKGKMRPFRSAKGKLKAPSAGKVVGRYSSKGSDQRSKGITIETVGGASVNAPYDGKVAYTGEFRGYGNMVILKHSQDYFTLMAGLGRIDASEGEVILEGEPLGAMQNGANRKLYVELRKGSEPMNPTSWFVGL